MSIGCRAACSTLISLVVAVSLTAARPTSAEAVHTKAAALVSKQYKDCGTKPPSLGSKCGFSSPYCHDVVATGEPLGAEYDGVYACGPLPSKQEDFSDPPFEDVALGFQCVELANRVIWDVYGLPPVASDIYNDYNLDGADFVSTVSQADEMVAPVANTDEPTLQVPYEPGDIVSFSGDEGFGHVAVVTSSSYTRPGNGTVTIMEQDVSNALAPGGSEQLTVSDWKLVRNPKENVTPLDFLPLGWSQQGEFVDSQDGALGSSVAIDGAIAAAAAPSQTGRVSNVYQDSAGVWKLQARLSESGFSGQAVALSGSTLVVGDGSANAAVVYSGSGAKWVRRARLTDPDRVSTDSFGESAGVSGTTAIVGDAFGGQEVDDEFPGEAFIYSESGGKWREQAKLVATDGAPGDFFGYSVAISGMTAVVGAAYHAVNGNLRQGVVYVFQFEGGKWLQTAELSASDGTAGDWLGISVAVAGTTVAAGAPGHAGAVGAAYFFSDASGSWTQAEVSSSDGASLNNFGWSVSVSDTTAVVGAIGHGPQTGECGQGSAYMFSSKSGSWQQTSELIAANGVACDEFGNSVSVSGKYVIVGAYHVSNSFGAVYFFSEH